MTKNIDLQLAYIHTTKDRMVLRSIINPELKSFVTLKYGTKFEMHDTYPAEVREKISRWLTNYNDERLFYEMMMDTLCEYEGKQI